MKIYKGISIFIGMVLIMGSCFDPPEFPVVPEIEYEGIEFGEGATTDSLNVYINFRDGDGDLGLDENDPLYTSYPFHSQYFFQTNPDGTLDTLDTFGVLLLTTPPSPKKTPEIVQCSLIDIADPDKGQLVFPRTRKNPMFSYLPADDCLNSEFIPQVRNLVIDMADVAAIDPVVIRVDTLLGNGNTKYLHIQDTLYTKINPNHYNIEVDFLVKDPGNPNADESGFVEFDWRKEYCQTFDGRFPMLTDRPGNSLEGTLMYSIKSGGLTSIFSVKTLKLRVQIKDRALNKSNVIETPEFTLDKIRKKG